MNKILLALLLVSLPCYADEPVSNSADSAPNTFHGQPIGPNLSPDEAEAYVDSLIPAGGMGRLRAVVNVSKIGADIQRLGLTNLLAIYKNTDQPTVGENASPFDPLSKKRAVLENAIGLAASPHDVGTLLDLYGARPLILNVFVNHPEWDTHPRLIAYLLANIDTLGQKPNLAAKSLLILLSRSPATEVQQPFATALFNLANGTSTPTDGHFDLDYIAAYFTTSSPVLAKGLPAIFTALTNAVSYADSTSDATKVTSQAVADQLSLEFIAHPEVVLTMASDPATRAAILQITQKNKNGDDPIGGARASVLAAICGSRDGLKDVANRRLANPSAIPIITNYLKLVSCQRQGDLAQVIIDNIGNAIYDNTTSTWAIPNEDGSVPPAPTLPKPAPTPTLAPQSFPAPAPTKNATPVAPAPPAVETPTPPPAASSAPSPMETTAAPTQATINTSNPVSFTRGTSHLTRPVPPDEVFSVVSTNGDHVTLADSHGFQTTLNSSMVTIKNSAPTTSDPTTAAPSVPAVPTSVPVTPDPNPPLAASTPSTAPTATNPDTVQIKKLNSLFQMPIFTGGSLWAEDARVVAKRLNWPQESSTSYDSSYRRYAISPGHIDMLGTHAYAMTLHAKDNHPTYIGIVLTNKNDFTGGSEADLTAAVKGDAQAISDKLTALLGPAQSTNYGISGDSREPVHRWDWHGHAILLSDPNNEYLMVKILPSDVADHYGQTENLDRQAIKDALQKRIVQRDNGDVVIQDIPMVDQGPKGYCVPATWERYLRYMDVPADTYELAMIGKTKPEGGTNCAVMQAAIDNYVEAFHRRIENAGSDLDLHTIAKYIDQGQPLMWGCYALL